jgi:hypothetical protein
MPDDRRPRAEAVWCLGLAQLALAVVLAGGCAAPAGWTETPFAREASSGASSFSAAATLLDAAHTGRLTNAYVRGAFVNLAESVDGLDRRLSELEGRPDAAAVQRLTAQYRMARAALDGPCIDAGCDWRAQVDTLEAAASALSQAADAT